MFALWPRGLGQGFSNSVHSELPGGLVKRRPPECLIQCICISNTLLGNAGAAPGLQTPLSTCRLRGEKQSKDHRHWA